MMRKWTVTISAQDLEEATAFALAIDSAATKEPVGNPTEAKRTAKERGPKATPSKNKK